jgi:hypothetical protein
MATWRDGQWAKSPHGLWVIQSRAKISFLCSHCSPLLVVLCCRPPPLPFCVRVAVVPDPSREWRRQSRSTAESVGWWKELRHHRALCIPSPWRRATGRRTKCKPATSLPDCVYLLLLCTFCVRFCVAIRHREATEA